MKVYQTNEIKNIALLGNDGSGKTTLTEALLFESGIIKRRGRITAKNTVSDYFPVEQEYGYSVFSTVFHVEWNQATGKKRISDEDGLSAIRKQIKALGGDADSYKLADGCGLSNYNYISPDLLVSFLKFAYSRTDVFQKLYKALPIGGVDGTLKYRMQRGTPSHKNVHAKTGSFTAINCLAGYLRAANGHEVAFAIMNQNVLS